jgi:hypothetical protein
VSRLNQAVMLLKVIGSTVSEVQAVSDRTFS